MEKVEIISKKSGNPVGPYSHGVVFGNLIFVSGQIGVNPKTGNLEAGIVKQTQTALSNMRNILEAGGSDMQNVLKVTIYLASMGDYQAVNEVYATFFHKPFPARAAFQVARLPREALVEIECIAYREHKGCCSGKCC